MICSSLETRLPCLFVIFVCFKSAESEIKQFPRLFGQLNEMQPLDRPTLSPRASHVGCGCEILTTYTARVKAG
jgi:hypothetical protein